MSARSRNARVARNCTNMEYQSRFTRHMRAMRRANTRLSLSHSSVYARINGSAFIYIHVCIDVTGDVYACPRSADWGIFRVSPKKTTDVQPQNQSWTRLMRATVLPSSSSDWSAWSVPRVIFPLLPIFFFLSTPAAPCNWQRYSCNSANQWMHRAPLPSLIVCRDFLRQTLLPQSFSSAIRIYPTLTLNYSYRNLTQFQLEVRCNLQKMAHYNI